MTIHVESLKLRRGYSLPGNHPSMSWRWSLESGLRSKDSRAVRRRVVGKVPIEATRWRPILPHVRFGGGRLETQVTLCAGRLFYILLGLIGPVTEAEEIKERITTFLRTALKLTLAAE